MSKKDYEYQGGEHRTFTEFRQDVRENMRRHPFRTTVTAPIWVPLAALYYGVIEPLRP